MSPTPTTTIFFTPWCPPTPPPSLLARKPFFPRAPPEPPTVHDNDPEGYITMTDLIIGLMNYTLVILAALLLGSFLIFLVPIFLVKIQRRRLLKLSGSPGEVDYCMSPRKNMKRASELGKKIEKKKKERKRAKDMERRKAVEGVGLGLDLGGFGRQGKKLEPVLEDVEMQWVDIKLRDGGCGAGVGKKC